MSHSSSIPWSAKLLARQFEQAFLTLRCMEIAESDRTSYFDHWPTLVEESWEEARCGLRMEDFLPTLRQIHHMQQCFNWLWLIDQPERQHLVWMRAKRVPWKYICYRYHWSRSKAWRLWNDTLEKLAERLNQHNNIKGKDSVVSNDNYGK